jgi:hypothetical protein
MPELISKDHGIVGFGLVKLVTISMVNFVGEGG